MESNNPHHNSDIKLLAIIFAIVGVIFLALTFLSFKYLKNVSADSWFSDLANKFHALVKEFEESSTSSYSSETNFSTTNSTTNSTSETNVKINSQQTPTPTPAPVCYVYQINGGEFASSKCYYANDYNLLDSYIYSYNRAVSSKNGAEAGMEITCDGSDFFEDNCERHKEQKEQAEKDIEKYRILIVDIIKKGL